MYKMIQLLIGSVMFASQLKCTPFLYCAGSNDFLDPEIVCNILRDAGVDAYNITDRLCVRTVSGRFEFSSKAIDSGQYELAFYGFPFFPWSDGMCKYELPEPMLRRKLRELPGVEIIVAPCPPKGMLDKAANEQELGSVAIAESSMVHGGPSAYLCGHVRASAGVRARYGMLFSNAAGTCNLIDV